jgi:hypothetical protein
MRRRTYHVGHADAGFPAAQDVLNGAAKLVGLHLNEALSLLNGHLAAVAMDLEGLELTPLMVVDSDPFPIGLALLLIEEIASWLIASQDRQRQMSSLAV